LACAPPRRLTGHAPLGDALSRAGVAGVNIQRIGFRPDGPELVKPSQHADGANRDWIATTWRWLLRDALGLPAHEPAWLDRPAVGRLTVSSPHLHRLLHSLNDGHGYKEQIKPFNFLLIAFVQSGRTSHRRPTDGSDRAIRDRPRSLD
jgi:hypothetical protein